MKKDKHPKYQEVLFVDSSTGHKFVCGSTLQTKQTETYKGKEYPVCNISISSSSHPFFTGSTKYVDAEGRVDKFKKRYTAAPAAPAAAAPAETAPAKKSTREKKK